jgi:hypothetical protein
MATFVEYLMPTCIAAVPENREWKQAYMAAVLEKNRTRVAGLIQEAKAKLSSRLDELTGGSVAHEEIEAIHDAYYLLQALQSSLSYREDLQN